MSVSRTAESADYSRAKSQLITQVQSSPPPPPPEVSSHEPGSFTPKSGPPMSLFAAFDSLLSAAGVSEVCIASASLALNANFNVYPMKRTSKATTRPPGGPNLMSGWPSAASPA